MQTLFDLILLFYCGSIAGWVLEFFFRRFFADGRKWVNPGFLTGPCLPIYGFGVCVLYLLAGLRPHFPDGIGGTALLILVTGVSLTLLEYIAGLIFVKGLKTALWDYSNEPFNLQGVICLRFSLCWLLAGAFYVVFLHPLFAAMLAWYEGHVFFTFVTGLFTGILLLDLAHVLQFVAKLRAFAKENNILVRYEEFKETVVRAAAEGRQKVAGLFAPLPDIPLKEHLNKYLERLQKRK